MREWMRLHSPSVAGFLLMAAIAAVVSLAVPVPSSPAGTRAPLAVQAIGLPSAAEDGDGDTYADGVDRAAGDLMLAVEVQFPAAPGVLEPYAIVGTQDDQWRTGRGAELAWSHVVDFDPLGRRAGSPAWQAESLRTGSWWIAHPPEDAGGAPGPEGGAASTTLHANVRDDRDVVALDVELRDASSSPHRRVGRWLVEARVVTAEAGVDGGPWLAMNATLGLEGEGGGGTVLRLRVRLEAGVPAGEAEAIARRWAPVLRFDSEETVFPVPGDALERFYGFARPAPDLRTWDRSFNDGRDDYRFFLADYNGDRVTDRADAAIVADLLAGAGVAPPTVYARVAPLGAGGVVVQYWFLYFYNYVLDEAGRDVLALRHDGDREFIQLAFADRAQALNGTPSSVAYSQHYGGLRIAAPDVSQPPFEAGRPQVFVASGSHASYPVAGDDRGLRRAFAGYFDRFDGEGRTLGPDGYRLELLGGQAWHAGYLWGPVTRYGRDLGTSARPLLQHDFRYPFVDPAWWEAGLPLEEQAGLDALYGGSP